MRADILHAGFNIFNSLFKKKKNDAVELGGTEKVKKEPRFNI